MRSKRGLQGQRKGRMHTESRVTIYLLEGNKYLALVKYIKSEQVEQKIEFFLTQLCKI